MEKKNTFSRIVLFIIYAWFGVLKLFNLSPANPLVASLLKKTLPFVTFGQFIVFLGLAEVFLGILFLFPRHTKLSKVLFVIHMVVTTMPMFLLPQIAWTQFLVPTLEGQYIIKNLALIALVIKL
jgi:uncharacterized membrane protein YkgB